MIGLNILGGTGYDVNDIVAAVEKTGAKWHVVMDAPQVATRLINRGYKVIYRAWALDDNAHQTGLSPETFVGLRHAVAPAGVYLYLGNEPTVSKSLMDWTLAAMKECDRLGRKGVILNLSTGHPEPSDFELLRPVLQYAKTHGHILGLHEYFDKHYINDYPYHVGRLNALYKAGLPMPQVVITELGCAVGFDPLIGYWGAMTDDEYGYELTQIDKYVYKPKDVHSCVFALARVGTWSSFDPSNRVLEIIGQYNKENVDMTVPAPSGNGVLCKITRMPSNFVNIRSQPNGADIGDAFLNESGYFYPNDVYQGWMYFKSASGVSGWVSLQNGAVVFTPQEVTPPAPSNEFEEVLDSLEDAISALIDLQTKLEALAQQGFSLSLPK